MAEIQALRALHYDLPTTGGLQRVLAPPYDVIGAQERESLERSSPYNVVRIDLPTGEDPYASAARQLQEWLDEGVLVREPQPALWALEQDFTGPDGRARTRRGLFARVRVEEYGAGRIRPHERTHPGPKEDRLRLTEATKANLSPIFSLFSDHTGTVRAALDAVVGQAPWGEARDGDGTCSRMWRIAEASAIKSVTGAVADAELLIADGHHRYETARVYAEQIGGEGPHRYVLMCLVALEDPGLTVFPTHRLLRGLHPDQQEALAATIRQDFEIEPLQSTEALAPRPGDRIRIGYININREPFMLALKDPAIADAALADRAPAYRELDTAVLEALVLKGALGMTDEDIDHLEGLGYARDFEQALELIQGREYDAAFFMAPTPIERIQAIAAQGESMPPKSTYFYPKIPTGLLFNPLWD